MQTLEFRDGERDIPDHLALLMKGIKTYQMTYEQAVKEMEQNQLHQKLIVAQRDLMRQHFRQSR